MRLIRVIERRLPATATGAELHGRKLSEAR